MAGPKDGVRFTYRPCKSNVCIRLIADLSQGGDMQLSGGPIDRAALSALGAEAAALLMNRNFGALADRFGYAFAYGREPAKAIEADLAACLAETSEASDRAVPSDAVIFFQHNDANLFAAVACVARMPEGPAVLMELVVTVKEADYHLSLEDIGRV